MKILLVNTTLHTGGASIACERLMKALVAHGHEVRLIVRGDLSPEANFTKRSLAKVRFCWERLKLLRDIPYQCVFSIDDGRCGTDIASTEDFEWADTIHLHWVNQAMLGINDIKHLVRRCQETGKCLVWTLHDIWAATGVCHLPGSCERWQTGCGHCPLLRRGGANDLSARTFERKREAYAQGVIHFVACSSYLADNVRKSPLLDRQQVSVIPNPIDTAFFSPLIGNKRDLRSNLGLPAEKRLVLFVAYNVNDENKGFRLVSQAIRKMTTDNIAVVPVGKNATQWQNLFSCEVVPFEYVSDAATMRDLYRACDLLVVASKMENLPNTIAEAKACGLPVVATRVGGIPEMIRHGIDGFLATPPCTTAEEDATVASLAEGMLTVLNAPRPEELAQSARAHAVATYSEHAVVQRIEDVYKH